LGGGDITLWKGGNTLKNCYSSGTADAVLPPDRIVGEKDPPKSTHFAEMAKKGEELKGGHVGPNERTKFLKACGRTYTVGRKNLTAVRKKRGDGTKTTG